MSTDNNPSQPFLDMAERISRNVPEDFAGAYVIVAPDKTVISHGFFSPKGDVSAFWGFISSAVQIAGTEAVEKIEQMAGMMRRGR